MCFPYLHRLHARAHPSKIARLLVSQQPLSIKKSMYIFSSFIKDEQLPCNRAAYYYEHNGEQKPNYGKNCFYFVSNVAALAVFKVAVCCARLPIMLLPKSGSSIALL